MLRPFTNITIQQIPTKLWSTRNAFLTIDFANEYEIESGWDNHTDCGKLKLPKNIQLQDGNYLFKERGSYNVILGGSGFGAIGNYNPLGTPINQAPLLMKGDIITINYGYLYFDETRTQRQFYTMPAPSLVPLFSGFISDVKSECPIEIEIQDAFYLLKHTPVNRSVSNGDLVGLCKYMLGQVNARFGANDDYINPLTGANYYPMLTFTNAVDNMTARFSLGYLDIGDITCSQLLSRIRSQYHLESFFVNNTMYFGFPIYDESRANSDNFFEFQNNIIHHNLEYKNKDDIQLSAIVTCTTKTASGKITFSGEEGTKKEKISVLVFWDVPTQSFKYISKTKGEPFPANDGGERHTFVYATDFTKPAPTAEELFNYGVSHLEKYFYTGFRGSFTTIGFPLVRWNDNVNLIDNVYSDRNGQYKVNKVKYSFSMTGIKQEIFIDYKQNASIPQYSTVYMI